MNAWGKNIKLEVYGTSHGEEIGVSISGLPAGTKIDLEQVSNEMARRRPGYSNLTTTRKEADEYEITSGIENGVLNGQTLKMRIRNTDVHKGDYNSILRPGHVDWTAYLKYGTVLSGGGQFSARLTAPIVFAGAIAKQILNQKGTTISAVIDSIWNINNPSNEEIEKIVLKTKEDKDSIGGTIKVIVKNPPVGLGSDYFGSIESKLASLYFSIPAVKAVEFGDGFELSKQNGSKTNDAIYIDEKTNKLYSKTNHMGGILGGLSNGMDIVARIGFKPTASIGKEQDSVDVKTMKPAKLITNGRHDPCVVLRAPVIVETYTALGLLDLLLDNIKEQHE